VKARLAMLVAVLAVVLVAATGCGGSRTSSAAATETSATTTTTTTTTTASAAASDDSSSSSSASGSSSSSSSSSSGTGDAKASQRCLEFAGFAAKFSQAFQGSGDAATDGAKLKDYFEALAEKAPSDIKASFRTFAEAFGKYFDTIKGMNLKPGETPSAEDLAKLQSAVKELDQADVKAASEKIQAWVQGGCK